MVRPRYLRISLTARCNLACSYCRPSGSAPDDGPEAEPTVEEIGFLAACAAEEGVRKVRLTGGEPLLRPDLEEIASAVHAVPDIREVVLTTNGIGLGARAAGLRRAGLARANVSLDTLRPERFERITGSDRLSEVLAGIEAGARVFEEVKLNTVILPGVNEDEIADLARHAASQNVEIRFIERYGAQGVASDDEGAVTAGEIRRRLDAAFGVTLPEQGDALSPAKRYQVPALDGARVGIIASSSAPPCGSCAKLRFTARGELQACLFGPVGADIRPQLRARDAAAVRRAIREVYAAKRRTGPGPAPAAATGINRVGG